MCVCRTAAAPQCGFLWSRLFGHHEPRPAGHDDTTTRRPTTRPQTSKQGPGHPTPTPPAEKGTAAVDGNIPSNRMISFLRAPLLAALILFSRTSSRVVGFAPITTHLSNNPFLGIERRGRIPVDLRHTNSDSVPLPIPPTRLHGTGSSGGSDGPSWIRDAMGDEFNDDEQSKDDSSSSDADVTAVLQEGLSGFAVDADLGFVAIIADSLPSSDSEDDDNNDQQEQQQTKWVYSVVSAQDKTQLMSAEALTLVQLAGNIDVGSAVLPPDALLRIVRDEMIEDEDDDDGDENTSSITKATLVGVEAVPREVTTDTAARAGEEDAAPISSLPERKDKIESDAAKLYGTIRKLPGLAEATEQSVQNAMQIHADVNGAVDREAFTNILDTLRRRGAGVGANDEYTGVQFRLTAQIVRKNGKESLVKVRSPSSFYALGLSMRYSAPVIISQDCFAGDDGQASAFGCGREELLERFPAFRPMQALLEDAQAVDGFIANMFYKENAPRAFE